MSVVSLTRAGESSETCSLFTPVFVSREEMHRDVVHLGILITMLAAEFFDTAH